MCYICSLWLVINAVAVYIIGIFSALDVETNPTDVLFFPKVVRLLKSELNYLGVIIATIVLSFLFLPALCLYFSVLCVIGLVYLLIKLFITLFRKKD